MPGFSSSTYVSPWLLRSQENRNKPAPLSFNKPVIKTFNNNSRVAFAPVRLSPKTRMGRKGRKGRKTRKGRKVGKGTRRSR